MKTFKRNNYFIMEKPFKVIDGFLLSKSIASTGDYQVTGIFRKNDLVIPNNSFNNFEFKALSEITIDDHQASESDLTDFQKHNLDIFIMFNSFARLRKMKERLKVLLQYLLENFSRDSILEFQINHEDISEMIGSTRCTVTREIRKLEVDGFISSQNKYLEFKKDLGGF
jgi:Crp-like helix-turn-helix domain